MNYVVISIIKSPSLNQGEDKEVSGELNSTAIHRDSQKMDFHNYVNKEITFVKSDNIMRYTQGEHTQLNIG